MGLGAAGEQAHGSGTRAGITGRPSSCFTAPGTPRRGSRLGRPTKQVRAPSSKGFPKSHAPTLPANGVSEPCSAAPRLLRARKPLPMEEPNGTVTVTGPSIRIPGRMHTGGDGNCVASSGLGSFLPQPRHGAGAQGKLGHGAAAPFCDADLHQPWVQR